MRGTQIRKYHSNHHLSEPIFDSSSSDFGYFMRKKYLSKPATETKTSLLSVHPFFQWSAIQTRKKQPSTRQQKTTPSTRRKTACTTAVVCSWRVRRTILSCALQVMVQVNVQGLSLRQVIPFEYGWIVHCHCWWTHQLLRLKHCILQFGNFTYQQVYWGFVHQQFDSFRPKYNFHPLSSPRFCLGNPTYFRVCSIFLEFRFYHKIPSKFVKSCTIWKIEVFSSKMTFCTPKAQGKGNPSTAQLS